jgi:hypothetical protein
VIWNGVFLSTMQNILIIQNIYLPAGLALLLMYLLKDGLLEHAPLNRLSGLGDVQPGMEGFRLTQAGREFVEHWLAADPVDSRLTIGLID